MIHIHGCGFALIYKKSMKTSQEALWSASIDEAQRIVYRAFGWVLKGDCSVLRRGIS